MKRIVIDVLFYALLYIMALFGGKRIWLLIQFALIVFGLCKKILIDGLICDEHSSIDIVMFGFYYLTFIGAVYTDMVMLDNLDAPIIAFLICGIVVGIIIAAARIYQYKISRWILGEAIVMGAFVAMCTAAANVEFDSTTPEISQAIITDKYEIENGNNPIYHIQTTDQEKNVILFSCDLDMYEQMEMNETVLVEHHDGFFKVPWNSIRKE